MTGIRKEIALFQARTNQLDEKYDHRQYVYGYVPFAGRTQILLQYFSAILLPVCWLVVLHFDFVGVSGLHLGQVFFVGKQIDAYDHGEQNEVERDYDYGDYFLEQAYLVPADKHQNLQSERLYVWHADGKT